MKLLLAAAVCLPCFASTIYPSLPPITEGQNAGYVTHGDTGGVLWTAGWFPDGANQSVWAVGFSAPVSNFSLTLGFSYPDQRDGASVGFWPASGGNYSTQWLTPTSLQVSGLAPNVEAMSVFVGGVEAPAISFQALVDPPAEAPEPGTIWLVALPIAALYTSARRRRIGLLHADVYERP